MRQAVYLGMTLFLATESVFFFMLLLAFVYFREASHGAPDLPLHLAVISTASVLTSCFAMSRARAGKTASQARVWIGAAALFGLIFLLAQWRAYAVLLRDGVTISESLFGTSFFTLTGMHLMNVIAGVLLLAGLDRLAPGNLTALRAAAMFWYFLGAVWCVIFVVVYLGIRV